MDFERNFKTAHNTLTNVQLIKKISNFSLMVFLLFELTVYNVWNIVTATYMYDFKTIVLELGNCWQTF